MNTTRKQKHLAACLRGGDHQRSESKAPNLALRGTRQPAAQGKPPREGNRADAAGQTAGPSNYRGNYTSPNGAAGTQDLACKKQDFSLGSEKAGGGGSISMPSSPQTLTDLTDSEVQTLQAGQTFVANAAAVEHIFRL